MKIKDKQTYKEMLQRVKTTYKLDIKKFKFNQHSKLASINYASKENSCCTCWYMTNNVLSS